MLNLKTVLTLSICVVWWMVHRTTAFFFFFVLSDHIQGSRRHFDSWYKLTEVPQRQGNFSTIWLYDRKLLEIFVLQWHAAFPAPASTVEEQPCCFLDNLETCLEVLDNGKMTLVTIIDLSCKNFSFVHRASPNHPSWKVNIKRKRDIYYHTFLTFGSETETPGDNCPHCCSVYLSFHSQDKCVRFLWWKRISVWR